METTKQIKKDVLENIKKHPKIMGDIAQKLQRNLRTVYNWVYMEAYNHMLCDINALEIISTHLNVPVGDLTEEMPVT